MNHPAPEAVGGPILTRGFKWLIAIVAVGFVLILWRFLAGLGATTELSDGYPWGLWIAFDVVTGTALACGGYAVAILCYVLNKGKYHPMVRPAILTSALGYTVAGFGIVLDVGRYWLLPNVFSPFKWNLNSVLLEVALCVSAYIVVLWIELSPAFLEAWREGVAPRRKKMAETLLPIFDRTLLFILAFGLLLPTMHQSSLGSLLLVAVQKLHPLWHTPLLPLLFLTSCLAMGYAVVVFEAIISSRSFKRPMETNMLASMSKVMVAVQALYLVIRFIDLAARDRIGLVFEPGYHAVLFWIETGLFLAPAFLLWRRRLRHNPGFLFGSAVLMILAGGLYRFDTYLLAYNPGAGWSYFPSMTETMVTVGLVALEVLIYIAVVKNFPILGGASRPDSEPQGV